MYWFLKVEFILLKRLVCNPSPQRKEGRKLFDVQVIVAQLRKLHYQSISELHFRECDERYDSTHLQLQQSQETFIVMTY